MLAFIAFFLASGLIMVVLSMTLAVAATVKPEASLASLPASDPMPWVPMNLAQLRASMDHAKFEYFSAALVIALGEGHRFHSRQGGAGDWGVDTKLLNSYGCIVIVQSKFYAHDHPVKPTEVRDFVGSLSLHDAVYGFFVTTSEFSKQAKQTAEATRGRVRLIDGRRIEQLLLHRSREIALALHDINETMTMVL